jgi:hypothetical protein
MAGHARRWDRFLLGTTAAVLVSAAVGCRSRQYVTVSPSELLAHFEVACAQGEAPTPRAECRNAGRNRGWFQFDYWDSTGLTYGTAYACTYRTPAAWLPDGFPDRLEPRYHAWYMRERLPPEGQAKLARIRDLQAIAPGAAIPKLAGYLMDDTPLVGSYAAHVLGQFGADACGPLEDALSEAGPRATPALIAAIGYCGCRDLTPTLLEMVMTAELSGESMGEAIHALVWMDRAGDVILIAREHESPTARMFARALLEESMEKDAMFRGNRVPAPEGLPGPPAS